MNALTSETESCGNHSTLLHNMSAPPRLRLTVLPLSFNSIENESLDQKTVHTGYSGLGLYGLLDTTLLFRHWFKQETVGSVVSDSRYIRLRLLVELVTSVLEGHSSAIDLKKNWLRQGSIDRMEDRFINLCHRVNERNLSLPAFGLVQRGAGNHPDPKRVMDPLIFTALVSRISGHVYTSTRSPVVPESYLLNMSFRLYNLKPTQGGH